MIPVAGVSTAGICVTTPCELNRKSVESSPHDFRWLLFLVLRIFTSILTYIAELMVRYIYGKPERWEWLFPKTNKNQSRNKYKINQEWVC